MSVKLSICIVAYNDNQDLKNALDSIEKYTSSTILKKIYVVDNNENELEVSNNIKKLVDRYQDVEYISSKQNIGFGNGHNKVLNLIDSEYHAIVNPDVLLCEDSFSKIIEWMDKNKNVGMTIPLIVNENGGKQEVYRNELTVFDLFNRTFLNNAFTKRAKYHTMQYKDYAKPFKVPFGQGSFLVVRSELFKELNGFDDNFYLYVEDADLCKRVNQISCLMYYPGTKVIHKWKKESHGDIKLFVHHLASIFYYFKKWGIKLI